MVSIRGVTADDIQACRSLLAQLGADLSPEEVAQRYQAVAASPSHIVMLAEQAGRVVGLCHVYERPAFDKPPEVVVQALVVDVAARHAGVGNALMVAAETWAADRGFRSVALSSHVLRGNAHAFYEAIGYQRIATSHLFRKDLETPEAGAIE